MTIQELYIFACKHDLLDKDTQEVITKYRTSSQQNSTNKEEAHLKREKEAINANLPFVFDKVEYSYEDVLALFST